MCELDNRHTRRVKLFSLFYFGLGNLTWDSRDDEHTDAVYFYPWGMNNGMGANWQPLNFVGNKQNNFNFCLSKEMFIMQLPLVRHQGL